MSTQIKCAAFGVVYFPLSIALIQCVESKGTWASSISVDVKPLRSFNLKYKCERKLNRLLKKEKEIYINATGVRERESGFITQKSRGYS